MVGMNLKQFLQEIREQGGSQTLDHIINVANLMYELAKALGKDEDTAMKWYYGGLLHDAGKLFVPAKILNSKTELTIHEYNIVMSHVKYGEAIIKNLRIHDKFKAVAINCANEHHAWKNGMKKNIKQHLPGGYYKGMEYKNLSGEALSEEGRGCMVCDIYDAMTADRSYSSSMSQAETLKRMDQMLRAGQLDARIYKVFVAQVLKTEYLASEKVA